MNAAPSIETQRLTLRAHRIDDFDAFAALFGSERSIYMDGPMDRRAAWNVFASDVAQWPLFGFGPWAIVETASGETLGQVGLQKPDHFPEVELGWVLYEAAEGKGYAFEAAEAARGFAYAECGLETLVSYIDRNNTRSRALAAKLGAVEDISAPLPSNESKKDTAVYRHPSPEALMHGGMEAYA